MDLQNTINILDKTKTYINNLRSDNAFNRFLVDAKELATEIDVDAHFPETKTRPRTRKVKRQFDYEASDEPIVDPKEKIFFSNIRRSCKLSRSAFRANKRAQ